MTLCGEMNKYVQMGKDVEREDQVLEKEPDQVRTGSQNLREETFKKEVKCKLGQNCWGLRVKRKG